MSYYKLTKFVVGNATITLPDVAPETPIGTGRAHLDIFPLSGGGVYVGQGDGRAETHDNYITLRATYDAATAAALNTVIDALYAVHGRRGKLYREEQDGTEIWTCAWFIESDPVSGPHNVDFQEMVITWMQQSRIWYGDTQRNTTSRISTHGGTMGFAHIGTIEVKNSTMSFMPMTTTVSVLRINMGSTASLFFTAAIPASSALVLDQSAWTVKMGGADWYSHLQFGATHSIGYWWPVPTTRTTMTVTGTSGMWNIAWSLSYRDGYR